jgi:Alpha-2,8-polysialyltransferase (POLYST)
MKEKIIIFTSTNYHLLLAISIIDEYFNDSSRYEIHVIKSYSGAIGKTVANSNINYKIQYIDIQVKNNKFHPETVTFLKKITQSPVKHFLFFNEDHLISLYMAISLKKRGTIIGLVQDGLKAYAVVNKKALRYRLLRTIEFYKLLKTNGLRFNFIYFFNIKYGASTIVDELWLTHPESTILASKPIHKINFLSNTQQVESANGIFGFSGDTIPADNVILFISSIVKDNLNILQVERSLIFDLQEKYPTTAIYIKVHPRTPKGILDKIKDFKNTIIINNEAPAELYIAKLNKAIIISAFSTALLYNNNASKYYWVYPMYEKHIKSLEYTKLINPTSHISIVGNVKHISF